MGQINLKKFFLLLPTVGALAQPPADNDTDQYLWFKVFSEVYLYAKHYYVEDVTPKELMVNAMKGMVEKLDPYSEYFTPEEFKEFEEDLEGEFGGVGVEITIKDGRPTIVAPIEGTPAYRAGLKAGDVIVEIDGEDTYGMSILQVVKRMRGEPGTPLELKIYRPSTGESFTVTVTRAVIKVTPVKWTYLQKEGVGYVKITQFQTDTGEKLKEALEEILKKNPKGIVLDLRNNPGGLLSQAVEVVDLFLPAGETVVSLKGRTENRSYETQKKPLVPADLKLVVLVNRGSASASEIVSGALQDYGRATLVGEQTFGKFSVQTPIPVEQGKYGVLKLTTAYYYTPKGRNLNGRGLSPDYEVKMSDEEWEKLRNAEREIRKEKNIPFGEPVVNLELDRQLRTAVDLITGRIKESEKPLKESGSSR